MNVNHYVVVASNRAPPPLNYIKINCDVSFIKEGYMLGYSVVCRDHRGRIVDGCVGRQGFSSVLQGETRALVEAMLFAVSRKFKQVIFETDSFMLVQAIQSRDTEIIWAIEADVLFIKSLLLFNSS
ncbi:conserved hypothetical protein [Ricinus communis]|uniref:RNase H type-1 domain-containing protein n=1 Tax=Ricinus communis TaxID=3988 RepID=B9T5G5_RICCO|nr:conserved hypothetical protein [Ricinus communis]